MVERSFAGMARFRRLARDYERPSETRAGRHFRAFALWMRSGVILLALPGAQRSLGAYLLRFRLLDPRGEAEVISVRGARMGQRSLVPIRLRGSLGAIQTMEVGGHVALLQPHPAIPANGRQPAGSEWPAPVQRVRLQQARGSHALKVWIAPKLYGAPGHTQAIPRNMRSANT
jgi:hypothetical protein